MLEEFVEKIKVLTDKEIAILFLALAVECAERSEKMKNKKECEK